ncbi:glycosylhydrolase-like jelly roll fold domain-containing protein [Sphingomonas sp. LH128]|uniref:glycosylhydrolase-like jelly roll fold domain-containing protein n=1 Tax=Sphingomonas sp. LH128 TaxID=473781 RepID=UPI000563CBF3|nr:glycosylhydrolase-like jelly roll fold domain-containing protein [Sphingomonas sp. LH128]
MPRLAARLDGAWEVAFEAERGAPKAASLPALAPLNEQVDPGIRYFSGIATYGKTFAASAGYKPGAPLLLDLAQVGDLAEVRVNGRLIGTLWHSPYRVDIGTVVRRGANRLEVRVANLWVNRLIGDAQPGVTKIASTVMPTYRVDAGLRPAGLIGPARTRPTRRGARRSAPRPGPTIRNRRSGTASRHLEAACGRDHLLCARNAATLPARLQCCPG